MNDAQFEDCYAETIFAIEEAMDQLDADMDYETVNNILTIICPDQSQIIITPQSATQQLWVAARSGGFHFDKSDTSWALTIDGTLLSEKLDQIFLDQVGEALSL